ncbi:GNAT family N-acetyltransferase [Spirosoma sp. HMF4905]|uniref:GNAT family N-acetyltransferase n=1 Tax=Spirosoma arboris TaxID=2682092 RepID=A0A7K1S9Q3_9BACT|nr:GNAT family N-acetyltransferase [Spirosoma arboris]MVM30510.1 GNAT family N-acetyltransferase [Spirosoma arboris]
MNSLFLYSSRLLFVASSPTLLQFELVSNQQLGHALNVAIPSDWPPGEYDQGAMQFFLDQLLAGGEEVAGWYGWYAITYPTTTTPATLVASGGYFGPPDSEGLLEIGYSVSDEWRRRGIATEVVGTLVRHAWQQAGVKRIIAHTMPDNQASIGVLTKNGFHQITSDDADKLCFEWLPNL